MSDDGHHTVHMGDMVLENVRIQTVDEAKERAEQIRQDAPETEYLTDSSTCDIDELIEVLKAAKAEGLDTVFINDDGQTRHSRPKRTNNHAHYHAMGPEPKTLREWVEL